MFNVWRMRLERTCLMCPNIIACSSRMIATAPTNGTPHRAPAISNEPRETLRMKGLQWRGAECLAAAHRALVTVSPRVNLILTINTMSPRKRKRSQAFEEHDETEDFLPQNQDGQKIDSGERDQMQLDKERDVWDAFREEHFEGHNKMIHNNLYTTHKLLFHFDFLVVEQLPLTLHRQFSLMRQLDEQAQGKTNYSFTCHNSSPSSMLKATRRI